MSNAQICRPIRLILDGFMQRNTPGTIKTAQPRSRLVVDPNLFVSIVPAASVLPVLPADDDAGIPVEETALSALVGEDAFDHVDSAVPGCQFSEIDHEELASWHADEDALNGVSVSDATYDDFLAVLEAI